MPLASLANLHWNGPGAAATVTTCVGVVESARANGEARAGGVTTASGAVTFARGTRLVNRPAVIAGVAEVVRAAPRARGRALAVVRVNALTQDDVATAILDAPIESGMTLRQAIRLLAAVNFGKTTIVDLGGGNATVTFRDVNDTKARVTASMTGSVRTTVTRDAT